MPDDTMDGIGPSEIRGQLDRIFACDGFSGSPRLQEFLEFVVQETLAGRGDRIKSTTIAQEVFDRGEDFDPQQDSIVRVEAGRLRRRLSQYYLTAGVNDPVLIEIPKGSYAVRFNRIASEPTEDTLPHSVRWWPPVTINRGVALPTLLLFATLLALMSAYWFGPMRQEAPKSPAGSEIAGPAKPFIVITPFRSLTGEQSEQRFSLALSEALVTDLSKLSELSVLAHSSMLNLEKGPVDIDRIKTRLGASHILRGSLERHDDKIRVNTQLIETGSKTTSWAERFTLKVEDPLKLGDIIVARILEKIPVAISAVETNELQHKSTNNPEILVLYRQALEVIMPPIDPGRILTSRGMFRHITTLDPDFAGGYVGQSLSHLFAVLFGNSSEKESDLQEGIRLAQLAIEKDGNFGLGHAALGFANCLTGDYKKCRLHSEKAILIQPGDAYSRWLYGMSLLLSGDPAQAVPQLKEAIRLDPLEPRTPYLNLLSMAYFNTGDYDRALNTLNRNNERGGPTGSHMDLIRAVLLIELGERDEAQPLIRKIGQTGSTFKVEQWLRKWLSKADFDRTMKNLYLAGLPQDNLN